MGAIPLGDHQILAMEKFEDRPMSPVVFLYLISNKVFTISQSAEKAACPKKCLVFVRKT